MRNSLTSGLQPLLDEAASSTDVCDKLAEEQACPLGHIDEGFIESRIIVDL